MSPNSFYQKANSFAENGAVLPPGPVGAQEGVSNSAKLSFNRDYPHKYSQHGDS